MFGSGLMTMANAITVIVNRDKKKKLFDDGFDGPGQSFSLGKV